MSDKSRRQIEREIIARAMKDEAFRKELLEHPRRVLERETGVSIPRGLKVRVVEESPEVAYLVLPSLPPQGDREVSGEELQGLAGTRRAKSWDNGCFTDSQYFSCDRNLDCGPAGY
jgi:hypothetical protein